MEVFFYFLFFVTRKPHETVEENRYVVQRNEKFKSNAINIFLFRRNTAKLFLRKKKTNNEYNNKNKQAGNYPPVQMYFKRPSAEYSFHFLSHHLGLGEKMRRVEASNSV